MASVPLQRTASLPVPSARQKKLAMQLIGGMPRGSGHGVSGLLGDAPGGRDGSARSHTNLDQSGGTHNVPTQSRGHADAGNDYGRDRDRDRDPDGGRGRGSAGRHWKRLRTTLRTVSSFHLPKAALDSGDGDEYSNSHRDAVNSHGSLCESTGGFELSSFGTNQRSSSNGSIGDSDSQPVSGALHAVALTGGANGLRR